MSQKSFLVVLVAGFLASTGLAGSDGTTVIVHGFQFTGVRPLWPALLAGEVATSVRADGGTARVLAYEGASGDLAVCIEAACGSSDADGHSVVVFDWAAESNDAGRGYSEAAGEALAAALIRYSQATPPLLDLDGVHLIGHSRGATVISEAAERLLASGTAVVSQLTFLDTHDWGAFRAPREASAMEGDRGAGFDDFDVNELHPEYDCGLSQGGPSAVCSWQGVGYVDSYYQDDDIFPPFLLAGRAVQGASNLHFDGLGLSHSDVHCWYRASISGSSALGFPGDGCTESSIGASWFGMDSDCGATVDRTHPLRRDVDGWGLSDTAGGVLARCSQSPDRQQVLFDFYSPEGLVNGDFEKQSFAGWRGNGGSDGGTLASDGGNTHLALEAGQQRVHGIAYVPTDAWRLQLRWRVAQPDSSQQLVVFAYSDQQLERYQLARWSLTDPSDWQTSAVYLPQTLRGHSVRFGFSVEGASRGIASVHLDDIGLQQQPESLLFEDGFESGDTTRWE